MQAGRTIGPEEGQPQMSEAEKGTGHAAEAVSMARERYLDDRHAYGCAETVFTVLKSAYGLPDEADPSAASALNGGIAYSGGTCGALTGAALAVGLLAERRMDHHGAAKRAAREIVAATMDAFREAYGVTDCRDLIGYDLRAPGGHQAFLESGAWRDGCMNQIEWVVARLAALADPAAWDRALREVENSPAH